MTGLFAALAIPPGTHKPCSAGTQEGVPALFHPGLQFSAGRKTAAGERRELRALLCGAGPPRTPVCYTRGDGLCRGSGPAFVITGFENFSETGELSTLLIQRTIVS